VFSISKNGNFSQKKMKERWKKSIVDYEKYPLKKVIASFKL
jgi:hypothetical protein